MASQSHLSKANTSFSLDLFKQLSDKKKTANVFFSPFSVSSALAMVMLGARENTAAQMSEILKTQECQDEVHTGFSQLLRELNKAESPCAQSLANWSCGCLKTQDRQDPCALSVANRLYGEKSYQFSEDFLIGTRKHYNAELEAADFITNSEAERAKINRWVESKTQGKIKDVLAQGLLDSDTRLVLVNAIYFKGNWKNKFPFSCNVEFRLNKNETKEVKMMRQKKHFPYTNISEANCEILEMPYQGEELSMLIFLPNDIEDDSTGLEELEKMLTYENFVKWTKKMKQRKVKVEVPQFKMVEEYNLNEVLMSMGMVDAFDKRMSDFSGMSPDNDLFLSKVVHKAFVEVNEEGTVAAASTADTVTYSLGSMPTPTFIADHPFLFFIRHNPSSSILFAGRCCSPE